jgi:hypothetical protein
MSHDIVMSLGSDCYTRFFLNGLYGKKETQLFDYIGSSMWSINDMIEADFEGLTDVSHYRVRTIIKGAPSMPVHERYNLRFLHDGRVITHNRRRCTLNKMFTDKLVRRAQRFKETITSARNPLFVRVQEKTGILWQPKDFPADEMSEILRFRELIRTKYGVTQCTIVYVNRDYDGEHDGIHCIQSSRTSGPIDSIRTSFASIIKS